MNKKLIFLGGTCNNSKWRDTFVKLLDLNKYEVFNPVVSTWNEEAQKKELEARAKADFVLYIITPLMTGVYSIAEVVDDSNKRPNKTLFCVIDHDIKEIIDIYGVNKILINFDNFQKKSLTAVTKMIDKNGAQTFFNFQHITDYLNSL